MGLTLDHRLNLAAQEVRAMEDRQRHLEADLAEAYQAIRAANRENYPWKDGSLASLVLDKADVWVKQNVGGYYGGKQIKDDYGGVV